MRSRLLIFILIFSYLPSSFAVSAKRPNALLAESVQRLIKEVLTPGEITAELRTMRMLLRQGAQPEAVATFEFEEESPLYQHVLWYMIGFANSTNDDPTAQSDRIHLNALERVYTLFIEEGHLNIDAKTPYRGQQLTGVGLAILHQSFKVLEYFVKHGANLNPPAKERETPLKLAAQSGNEEMIRFLVRSGANIYRDSFYENSDELSWAMMGIARGRTWQQVRDTWHLLLDLGANLRTPDKLIAQAIQAREQEQNVEYQGEYEMLMTYLHELWIMPYANMLSATRLEMPSIPIDMKIKFKCSQALKTRKPKKLK